MDSSIMTPDHPYKICLSVYLNVWKSCLFFQPNLFLAPVGGPNPAGQNVLPITNGIVNPETSQ